MAKKSKKKSARAKKTLKQAHNIAAPQAENLAENLNGPARLAADHKAEQKSEHKKGKKNKKGLALKESVAAKDTTTVRETKSSKSSKTAKSQVEVTATPSKPRHPAVEHLHSAKEYLLHELFLFEIDKERFTKIKESTLRFFKIAGISLVTVVALSSLLILTEFFSSQKILPNTTVGGVKIGYMPVKTAQQNLLVEVEKYTKTPLTFEYEGQKASFTPDELGIKFNLEQTYKDLPVFDYRRQGFITLGKSLIVKNNINLRYTVNLEKIRALLEEKFALAEKRAKNAHLALNDKEYAVTPETSGVKISDNSLSSQLVTDLNTLQKNNITLSVESEYPTVTALELEKQKDRLLALLQRPVALVKDNKKLTLKMNEHLDAVDFTMNGNKEIGISLVSAKLVPYLEENLLKKIEVPTSPVNISQDKDGKITIEGKAEDGVSVPRENLIASLSASINGDGKQVEVPVVTEKAPVTISDNLKDLGIKELLATGHSAYYGSPPNRMHNINLGISKYNGVLVKPGEEFSFNKYLGEVDAKNGFKAEKVIKKNKIELEMGGGLCQVSTTIYRAAILAGLPITERAPHSWKVSYYGQSMGHGMDATVYIGVSDLKFVNDTPGHLLIQSYVDGSEAYFKFYGTNDGRTVAMEGPIGGGLHYKWYRTITKADGTTEKETIISNYKPIPPPDPPATQPKTVAQTLTTPPKP